MHLPAEVAHLPLSQVAVSGVKLLAIPPTADRPEDLAAAPPAEPAGERLHQLDAAPLPPEPVETRSTTLSARAVRAARAGLAKADEVLRRYDS